MFERFTERARQVVWLAQEEARDLKHDYIGTEHILLGLLREGNGVASKVLDSLGITVEGTRDQVTKFSAPGATVHQGQIPFTPRTKKTFEGALREALSFGQNYIGTEHILLALVRENGEGVAARILLDFDADSEKIRNEVIRHISGSIRGTTPVTTPTSGKTQASRSVVFEDLLANWEQAVGDRPYREVIADRKVWRKRWEQASSVVPEEQETLGL